MYSLVVIVRFVVFFAPHESLNAKTRVERSLTVIVEFCCREKNKESVAYMCITSLSNPINPVTLYPFQIST